MICPHCGQWAPEQALRCPNCQQPLDNVDAPTISATGYPPTRDATMPEWPAGLYAAGSPPAPPPRQRTAPSSGMAIALTLIVVGTIGLLAFALLAGNILDPHTNAPVVIASTSTVTFTPTPSATATPSPTATPTMATPIAAISAGGQGTGGFSGDMDFSGGTTDTSTATIDTSNVTNPAPQSVYQSERWGDFTYTIPALTAGASYKVRLHFAEIYFSQPGQRIFNVAINGQPVLENFDIVSITGGENRAIVKEFDTNADNQGQITIAFTHGSANNPKVSGIEVIANS